MKNYLVTGAAGFVGAALARSLLATGNHVFTVDNLSTGFLENIPNGVTFVEGDCGDADIVAKLEQQRFDAIYHIAGQSSGEVSFEDPVYDLQTNAQSTLNLLQLARRTSCDKFIYASTMSVYGDVPDQPTKEQTPTEPRSFYAVGKLASEQYLRIFSGFGINCTALRLFNIYGPGQNMENLRQGIVSIFLQQALSNRHILIKGSADRYRDFVYIDDVVSAFIAAERAGLSGYNCVNIGTGVKTLVGRLVDVICSRLSEPITTEYRGQTPGDQHGIYADIELANKVLGWSPSVDLEEGLGRMIAWAMGHVSA